MVSKVLKSNSNNKVSECRVLGGIDTLYFFVNTNISSDTIELYQNLWNKVEKNTFHNDKYEYLNHSGQKSGFIGGWYLHKGDYDIPLFRIGFKNPNKQLQVNNIQIQLYASGIYSMGFTELIEYAKNQLNELLCTNLQDSSLIVSRVDLNAFVDGYDFSTIDPDMFRTRFITDKPFKEPKYYQEDDMKSYEYRKYRRLETMYLGNSSSPLSFKIYDKIAEISSHNGDLSSMIKRSYLGFNGLNSDHIWNIEFKIKREVLLQYCINSYADLKKSADSIFKDLIEKTAFLGYDLDKIKKFRQNKNISKLQLHPIWQKIKNDYKMFGGVTDVHRCYIQYKDFTKDKSIEKIKHELIKQIGLDQGFTQREYNSIFYQVNAI